MAFSLLPKLPGTLGLPLPARPPHSVLAGVTAGDRARPPGSAADAFGPAASRMSRPKTDQSPVDMHVRVESYAGISGEDRLARMHSKGGDDA